MTVGYGLLTYHYSIKG